MNANSAPALRLEGVTKSFGDFRAVDSIDLDIAKGEFFSLLGPSGCGKSTLLRMMAGLDSPTGGRILIDGVDQTGVPPYLRPVNMMFQSYALFPHMTVSGNIAFGLKQEDTPKPEIVRRVGEALEMVQLSHLAARKPHQLSGGQRQRVALARCLVKRPKVVLLDEPLGALDKKLRRQTQFELVRIHRQVGITFVIVTHDQEEAMTMSTRIAVMDKGTILQLGKPRDIYEYPVDRTVAEFIGTANLFDGHVISEGDGILRLAADGIDVPLAVPGNRIPGEEPATLLVRPEKIVLGPVVNPDGLNVIEGVVDEIAYLGGGSVTQVRLNSGRIVSVATFNPGHRPAADLALGQAVTLSWAWDAGVLLP